MLDTLLIFYQSAPPPHKKLLDGLLGFVSSVFS